MGGCRGVFENRIGGHVVDIRRGDKYAWSARATGIGGERAYYFVRESVSRDRR
jgi:hypothetical protein